MDERPRNLRAMLSEAKDTSELMVDLGYAAVFFADERMADEVEDLEERLTDLVHEMRVVALRRGRDWLIDPDGDEVLLPDDVLIMRGAREGIAELRELAGAPVWRPAAVEENPAISDLDRAVDVLVEMKNFSEAAVGLAYSALLLNDQGLATQVIQLEDRLDEMREQLELWVLRAGAETVDPSGLRGRLHIGAASEEAGDAAQQLVWLVEQEEEMHPILAVALGEADEVFVQYPIAAGSLLDGAVVTSTKLGED